MRKNHGTYWTKGDMMRVKTLRDRGEDWKTIARLEGRSVNACVVRYRMFGVVNLLQSGGQSDTLITMRKK